MLELAVAKIIPALAGVLFIALASNYFTPETYGKFAIVFATSNLLVVISTVWISQSVMRFTGGGIGEKSMGAMVLIALAFAALLACATGAFSLLPQNRQTEELDLILVIDLVVLTLSMSLNTTTSAYAISLQRYRVYRIAEVGRALLLVISVTVVATLNNGISGLAMSYALATAIPSIVLLFYLTSDNDKLTATHNLSEIFIKFIRYGWPMTIWAGLQATQSVMERSVLSRELSSIEFGNLMAANDIVVRGIGLMLMPVVTLLHSQLMASAGHGVQLDERSKSLLTSGVVFVLLGGSIIGGSILLGRDLVGYIAPGIRQLDLLTVLAMCISAVAWTLALIIHKPLELRKSTILMSILIGAAIGLQWVLLNVWVGGLGALAMPLASICAASSYMLSCLLVYRKN